MDTPLSSVERPIISSFASDPAMADLIEMFVEELPDRAAAIQNAAQESNYRVIRNLAHQLTGSGGSCGFQTLTDAAGQVERLAANEGDLDQLNQAVRELCRICLRARTK